MKVKTRAGTLKGKKTFRPNIDPVFVYACDLLLGRQGSFEFCTSVTKRAALKLKL
jgi:hypothetical protein